MMNCPRDVFRDAIAHSVISKAGGKQVARKPAALSGNSRDGGHSNATVLEYATPDGEVIARKVEASGRVECWLRVDLCTDTLIARADAEAEILRLKKEVVAYANATRRQGGQRAETYVLSSALIHAAARRNATLGRLWDQNSRGDAVRGNLAAALGRAVKAEGGVK